MSYSFDIIGVSPIFTFFNYQQQYEQDPKRGKTYLGSHKCTLDGFIESTKMIPKKPHWNWDEVFNAIVDFWLKNEDTVRFWNHELKTVGGENIIVARVVNYDTIRSELESVFRE